MAWSTKELADLAGTTVNAVRHYHSVGLLDEPQRRLNGYKQYRSPHLASLIRVRRLVELGMPLARIADLAANAPETLRALDEELQAGIDRLSEVRQDIAALSRARAPLDTPRGFESVASGLSDADRALIHICSRLLDDDELCALPESIAREPQHLRAIFDALRADADDEARDRLAHDIAAENANWRAIDGRRRTGKALTDALRELYNPAQQDVIHRAAATMARLAPAFD